MYHTDDEEAPVVADERLLYRWRRAVDACPVGQVTSSLFAAARNHVAGEVRDGRRE